MSANETQILWAVLAPIAIISAWFATKSRFSSSIQIVIRSFVIALSCGFVGVGTDSAAIIIPLWKLVFVEGNWRGVNGILAWWLFIVIVYFTIHILALKLSSKRQKQENIESNENS